MPATLDEVRKMIQDAFPGAVVDQILETDHRISGVILWRDFKGKDSPERNRLVAERVRDRLGLHGMNVGILFPLAPGERL